MPVNSVSAPTSGKRQAATAAESAERESRERISRATAAAENAEAEAKSQAEQVRDEYTKQTVNESARQELAYANLKQKGYEQISKLQNEINKDLKKVQDQGEKSITDHHTQLVDEFQTQKVRGEKDYHDLVVQNTGALEMEKTRGTQQKALLEYENQLRQKTLQDQISQNAQKLEEEGKKNIEQTRAYYTGRQVESKDQFEQSYQSTVKGQTDSIQRLNQYANQKLKGLRSETALKLAAYDTRQTDPFYKMLDLQGQIEETQDAFILTARIPPHEQDQVSVNVSGNRVVVTGRRKNEEKLDIGPGRTQSTASYQSFSESYPLTYPVNARLLQKEFSGDQLKITIPKINRTPEATPFQKPAVELAKQERPHFPGNLPTIEKDKASGEIPESPPLG